MQHDFFPLKNTDHSLLDDLSHTHNNVNKPTSDMPVLPPLHIPGVGMSLCPVIPPLPYGSLLSQHDPDNTICHFLQDNLDGAPIPSFLSHLLTFNPAPLHSWAAAGGITPDDHPTAGLLPVPSNTHSARRPTGAMSRSGEGTHGITSATMHNSTV